MGLGVEVVQELRAPEKAVSPEVRSDPSIPTGSCHMCNFKGGRCKQGLIGQLYRPAEIPYDQHLVQPSLNKRIWAGEASVGSARRTLSGRNGRYVQIMTCS